MAAVFAALVLFTGIEAFWGRDIAVSFAFGFIACALATFWEAGKKPKDAP
jgi:hypothetical protein